MKLTKEEKQSLKKRITSKIEDIENYLNALNSFRPETLEEYEKDEKTRWACERACERIAEAVIDLAIFLIRYKELMYNEEDEKAFGALLKNNLIEKHLYEKLHNLKGMRDKIAHRYGEINNEIVFKAIDEEIEKDVIEFLEITRGLTKEEKQK